MPAPDFKKLHKEWKKAKDNAKLIYSEWVRLNTDLSNAHQEVKFTVPSFPKFNLDLGPSLEKIEKKKDVEKSKVKCNKAVTQYEKDIKALLKAVKKIEPGEDKKKIKTHSALILYLGELMGVRDNIKEALEAE